MGPTMNNSILKHLCKILPLDLEYTPRDYRVEQEPLLLTKKYFSGIWFWVREKTVLDDWYELSHV